MFGDNLTVFHPKQKGKIMLLATIVDQVAMECDIEQTTLDQYRRSEKRYSSWIGRPATYEDLSIDNLNGFMCDLQKKGLSGTTCCNYRVSITRLWNYATKHYNLPRYDIHRVRKPKIQKKPVVAWMPGQVQALLRGSQDMIGRLKIGIDQSAFMRALILTSYDTGLRPIDLRLLRWSSLILPSKSFAITQHKTMNPHSGMLSDDTVEALKAILSPARDLVFPLSKGGMRRLELLLYKESIRHGFYRAKGQGIGTIRKSHATAIYLSEGECAAAESLGHVGGVRTARASYIDHRAIKQGRLPVPLDLSQASQRVR
jgi:integrase